MPERRTGWVPIEDDIPRPRQETREQRLSLQELKDLVRTVWMGGPETEAVTKRSVAGAVFRQIKNGAPAQPLDKLHRAAEEFWTTREPDPRAQTPFQWPVTKLPITTASQDSVGAYVMTDKGPGFSHTSSQDRIALEFGAEGELRSFAIGDGVSKGAASAGTADFATRCITRALANLPKTQLPLSQEEAKALVEAVAERMYRANPLSKIIHELNENLSPQDRQFDLDYNDLKANEAGGTTLRAGVPHREPNGDLVVDLLGLGDGGYVILNPQKNQMEFHLEDTAPGQAPGQLAVGLPGTSQPLGQVTVERVAVPKGSYLILLTDGVRKNQVIEAIKALHRAKQKDWSTVSARDLARQLLEKASGLSDSSPQAFDDRSVVVLKG